MFKIREYNYKSFSLSILLVVISLGSVGMFLIQRLQDEGESLFQKQVAGYAVGIVVALVVALIDYHFICKFFVPLYFLNVGLLLFCKYTSEDSGISLGGFKIYGYKHFTAKRWIKLEIAGRAQEFMPSEITKILMIIVLAKYFDLLQKQVNKIYILIISGLLMLVPVMIIQSQPNLSTALVLVILYAFMVLASGVKYRILGIILMIGIPICGFLVWYIQQDNQVLFTEYQQSRVVSFFNPSDEESTDDWYQQHNSVLAIEAGGMWGKLLTGDTSSRGTRLVPVIESDFIFSAVGEEFGVFGMSLMIFAFLLFAFLGIRIAKKAKDYLGMMLAMGFTSLLTVQAFVNMGVVTALLPNTGIPLPFVSSGLSALLGNFIIIGILLNISLQPKVTETEEKISSQDLFYIA